jgi:hypothetical protein
VQRTNCDLEMKLRGWVSSAQKRLATPTTTTKPKPPTKCPKTKSPTEKSIFTKPPTGRTELCVVHLKKGNDKVARSKTRKLLATHVKISEKNLDESSVATKLGNYRILPLAAAAVRRLARKDRYAEMSLGCSWWSVKIGNVVLSGSKGKCCSTTVAPVTMLDQYHKKCRYNDGTRHDVLCYVFLMASICAVG